MNGARVTWAEDHDDRIEALFGILERPAWHADAACSGRVDLMFPNSRSAGRQWREAVAICATCPVRIECDESAEQRQEVHGVWGGKRRQNVSNRLGLGLHLEDGEWTPAGLAEVTGTNVRSIRRWLRAGVGKGYLVDRIDPDDRRRRLYSKADNRRTT